MAAVYDAAQGRRRTASNRQPIHLGGAPGAGFSSGLGSLVVGSVGLVSGAGAAFGAGVAGRASRGAEGAAVVRPALAGAGTGEPETASRAAGRNAPARP